jgi:S-adenosylmethionine hydrolase
MKQLSYTRDLIITAVCLLLTFSSCAKNESGKVAGNLVLVTDTDPGSFLMIKILGEVRSSFPDIHITYLQSKKFDISDGAFLLGTAVQSFPDGTVFAGIIEPGANSKRIVFEVGLSRVFSPDNTLSTRILHDNPGTSCYFVENPVVLGETQPNDLSFEDFYSRAVCSLISGTRVSEFGSICSNPKTFPVQDPVWAGDSIAGEILFTDNFGNCITNIPESLMIHFPVQTVLAMKADTVQLNILVGVTYSSVAVGENVCFINSSKLLELAVNYGNFAGKYGISAGSRISLGK